MAIPSAKRGGWKSSATHARGDVTKVTITLYVIVMWHPFDDPDLDNLFAGTSKMAFSSKIFWICHCETFVMVMGSAVVYSTHSHRVNSSGRLRVSCSSTALGAGIIGECKRHERMIPRNNWDIIMSYSQTFDALRETDDILTTGQTVVLAVIATFTDVAGKSWPSIETIARATKLCIRTVKYRIAELIKLGFLKRIIRQGKVAISIITEQLSPAQSSARHAPQVVHGMHPEEVIESVNQITAPSQIDSVTATADVVIFETVIPDSRTAAVLTDLPIQTASQTATTEPVASGEFHPDGNPDSRTAAVTVIASEPLPAETVNPFAGVEPQLLADFGVVRKAKKKAPTITRTEALIFANEAQKAGMTVAQAMFECVTRGWSRFQAEWLPPKPLEQATRVFVPPLAQPATPEIKAAGMAAWSDLRIKFTPNVDPLAWAKNALARHDAGEKLGSALLRNARLALRI
jgi:Helix-turn-helix domain